MKQTTNKQSLKQRLLATLIQSSLATIQVHGMGIPPLEAYAFLEQKGMFSPDQPYLAQFPTPTIGGQNDTNAG